MTTDSIRAALRVIAAEIERGNHRSAQRQIGKLIDSLPPATDVLASAAVAAAPTVGALLSTAPEGSIVEYRRPRSAGWSQVRQASGTRVVCRTRDDGWTWGSWKICATAGEVAIANMRQPARLVPADQADADPATRGPIGGGR